MNTRKTLILTLAVLALTLAAQGADRIRTAVLPVDVVPKTKLERMDPGEYLLDRMIMGMNKVERFNVIQAGDIENLLEENLFKPADIKPEKAAELARALKADLLIFPKIDDFKSEIRSEDRVLITVKQAVCSANVSAVLYDAATKKLTSMGPYLAEKSKVASKDQLGNPLLTAEDVEEMLKDAIEQAAKKVRGRVYKEYPLIGTITAASPGIATIDIGTEMGVTAGHYYAVTALKERENPVTGLPEKVPVVVSVLEVKSVTAKNANCNIVSGEKNPPVGSQVTRTVKPR